MEKISFLKSKQLFSWKVLVLGLLLLVATACSDNSEDASQTSAPEGGVDPDELSGEIEVWGWNVAAATFEIAADMFMEEHPNVTVNVRDIGDSDLYERMTVGMGSGGSGLPDVSIMHSDEIAGYANQFPDQFMNLTEWGFDEYEGDFVDFKSEVIKNSEGNIVAMPWDIGPTGIFYRVDYFEEAGVNPDDIETWDDYIEAGKKVKEVVGVDMLPLEVSSNDGVYRIMLNQLGSSYFTEDEEININSPESQQAFEVIQKMYQSDIVANAADWDAQVGLITNEKVASIPTAAWYSGTLFDQAPDQEGKWDMMPVPAFEEGGNRAANMGGSDIIIPSSTDNPELAYAFAEFFTTNVEVQMEGFKQYGLFPSLLATFDEPYFDEPVQYFNGSPVYKTFSEVAEEVKPSVYTSQFARAQDVVVDAQASMLLDNESVSDALANAAERLESETGLTIAE